MKISELIKILQKYNNSNDVVISGPLGEKLNIEKIINTQNTIEIIPTYDEIDGGML